MPNAFGTFRLSVWDEQPKLPESPSSGFSASYRRKQTLGIDGIPRRSTARGLQDAAANWSVVRKAVNATRFWKRASAFAIASEKGADLGSLKQFIDKRKLEDVAWTVEEWTKKKQDEEIEEDERQEAMKGKSAADLEDARTTASSGFHKSRATTASSGARATTAGRATTASSSSRPATTAGRATTASSSSRPQTVPQTPPTSLKLGGERRKVFRIGKLLSNQRVTSPRNLQLRQMLPENAGLNACWEAAWARSLGLDKANQKKKRFGVSTRNDTSDGFGRPITAPEIVAPVLALSEMEHHAAMEKAHMRNDGTSARFLHTLRGDKVHVNQLTKESCFTEISFSSNSCKPRAEVHPLLTAIEGMQHDEVFQSAALESGILAQRLDELRWGELRRGAWTSRPERRKPAEKEKDAEKEEGQRGGVVEAPGRQLVSAAIAKSASNAGIKDIHGSSDEMQRLIDLVDPDRAGTVAPEVFVPLFFWLGLTRRRTAALMTLELAFGPGDIDVASIQKLSRYAEVQIRLIEGLRHLARRESLEQLCEFITDMARIRTWFQTMKRDTTGHVDIVEVQNLFARMEVTSDRQTLFRFLTHIVHSDTLPTVGAERGEVQGAIIKRTFGIGDFASLLCRCATAWLLHRTLMLLSPSECGPKGVDGPLLMPAVDLDREAEMRWVALQRKIIISLLVNHRFWGRESRTVLSSLTQPQMTTLGSILSPEQWLSLFQRVRAQGIASTLPVGDEATDPEWLHKMARNAEGGDSRPVLPQLS